MNIKHVSLVARADDDVMLDNNGKAIEPAHLSLPCSLMHRITHWGLDICKLPHLNGDARNTAVQVHDLVGFELAREIKQYLPESMVSYVTLKGITHLIYDV